MTNLIAHIFHDLLLGMITEGIMRVPAKRPLFVPEAARTLDWLGVNYYQRYRIQFNARSSNTLFMDLLTKPGEFTGPGGWGEIHPQGLFDTLSMLWNRYHLPVFITENGIPDETDEHRPSFIVTHLNYLWKALRRGFPVLGYYFWSLLDNFEWTEGYDPRFRFGLIGVDFETQNRYMRTSGKLYSDICHAGGLTAETVAAYTPDLLPGLFRAG
jgi:beta-glucosidase